MSAPEQETKRKRKEMRIWYRMYKESQLLESRSESAYADNARSAEKSGLRMGVGVGVGHH
jgi:hypothetical protein